MILFVTIVLKNIYSTNNFRKKKEFFSLEKCTSFGLLPLWAKHSGLCESNSRTWFESSLKQGTSKPHLRYHKSLLIFIPFFIICMTFMAIFLLIFVFIVIVAYLTIVFLRIIAPIGSRCAFLLFVVSFALSFFVFH